MDIVWGICIAIVLFLLVSAAIQGRTMHLITGGVFIPMVAAMFSAWLVYELIVRGLHR